MSLGSKNFFIQWTMNKNLSYKVFEQIDKNVLHDFSAPTMLNPNVINTNLLL